MADQSENSGNQEALAFTACSGEHQAPAVTRMNSSLWGPQSRSPRLLLSTRPTLITAAESITKMDQNQNGDRVEKKASREPGPSHAESQPLTTWEYYSSYSGSSGKQEGFPQPCRAALNRSSEKTYVFLKPALVKKQQIPGSAARLKGKPGTPHQTDMGKLH